MVCFGEVILFILWILIYLSLLKKVEKTLKTLPVSYERLKSNKLQEHLIQRNIDREGVMDTIKILKEEPKPENSLNISIPGAAVLLALCNSFFNNVFSVLNINDAIVWFIGFLLFILFIIGVAIIGISIYQDSNNKRPRAIKVTIRTLEELLLNGYDLDKTNLKVRN